MGVGEFISRLLSVDEWNIGLTDLGLDDLAGQDDQAGPSTIVPIVNWLPKPWFVRYQADPCLLEDQGRLYLYYEEVLVGSTKGRLRCTELHPSGAQARRGAPMISLPYHAAYPYVFKHMDTFYCIPETGARNQVALHKSGTPLGPWILDRVLLEGVSARDSTVIQYADRWWLFCTVAGTHPQSQWAELHIWHAPDFRGPWEPHALQPAKTDIRSSRPAGRPFTTNGALYRPAQDCSARYGGRVVINRVLTLTPHEFAEEVSSTIEADPLGPYGEGLHTISGAGGLLVVDGHRKKPTINPFRVVMEIPVKVRRRVKSRPHKA